ncbi:MAG: hypothetical protein FK730_12640 [Asgard group archaeon]|nr:hypothetical protein [Asgard group archaeon]
MPLKRKREDIKEELRKKNQIIVNALPEMLDATTNLGKGEIEIPKEIKEIEALIFSRGRLNAQFFRGRKDLYVVPNWVHRMLDHNSKGAISLGHSSSFINTNYRDWVAFGGLDCVSEGIVTARGLVVPIINGYGILSGALIDNKPYYITRDGRNKQSLQEGYLPIVINNWELKNHKFKQTVFGSKSGSSEIGVLKLTKKKKGSQLILSIRPFNQEGVTLINSIVYRPKDHAIIVNKELALRVIQAPESLAVANYHLEGDSAIKLTRLATRPESNKEVAIDCPVGLANMTLIFPMEQDTLECYFRMTKDIMAAPPVQENVANSWKEKLSLGLQLKTGDKEINRLFKANLVNLLLLVDPGTVTPGPTEYHRFWCRDAAYLINALDRMGYHNYARDALNQFIIRQRNDGFYYSHEGEYDSNGEGIWALSEHFKFTRDITWLETVYESIEKAAKWLIETRKQEKDELIKQEYVSGLLPPGFSAEHLGPCDYFYWDNFWGVTGLREATYCAKILQKDIADYFQKEYQSYLLNLLSSTSQLFDKFGYLPVGPYRECDSAMIANLCASHPTKLWDHTNEILRKTAEVIYNKFTHNGGFFHEVAWNCYGTYLTMHLAQVYHEFNEHEKVFEILNWLVKNQTCLMGWAEGISPQTMEGGMGDSPHGWASADWLHLIRNLFVSESLDGSIKLLSGYPLNLLRKGISVKNLETYYGKISYTAKLSKKTLTLKLDNQTTLPTIKIMTPSEVIKMEHEKGEAMVVGDNCVEISKRIKKIVITIDK